MKYLILAIVLFFSNQGYAQRYSPSSGVTQPGLKCIKLEGIALPACVPSTREVCHSGQPGNCSIRGDKADCKYELNPLGVVWKPINDESASGNLECADYGDPICPPGESDIGQCQRGQCKKYKPPFCRAHCVHCVDNVWEEKVPIPGCARPCGADYCSNESQCQNSNSPNNQGIKIDVCPIKPSTPGYSDYIKPEVQHISCKAARSCPDSVRPPSDATPENCPECVFLPDGNVRVNVVKEGSCPCNEQDPKNDPNCRIKEGPPPQSPPVCPWISYSGHPLSTIIDEGGGYRWDKDNKTCRPVEVGNRYPIDCCECNNNSQNIEGSGRACQTCENINNSDECAKRPRGGNY